MRNSLKTKFLKLLLDSLKDKKSFNEYFQRVSEIVLIEQTVFEARPSPVQPGIKRLVGKKFFELGPRELDSLSNSKDFGEKIGSSQSLALKDCLFNLKFLTAQKIKVDSKNLYYD